MRKLVFVTKNAGKCVSRSFAGGISHSCTGSVLLFPFSSLL